MDNYIKIIKQTCKNSPSQWDGELNDGREIYIRYRWGTIEVYVANMIGQKALDGDCILDKPIGDEYDGKIKFDAIYPMIMEALNNE